MKLKITQGGWEGFTGNYGGVEFVNGVSVEDINTALAQRLSAIIGCVDAATDKNPSVTQALIDAQNTPMDAGMAPLNTTNVDETKAVQETDVEYEAWTREGLEKLASEKGIAGLREIATPAGITGKKITDLIAGILAKGLKTGVLKKAKVAGDDSEVFAAVAEEEVEIAPSARAAGASKKPAAPTPTPEEIVVPGEKGPETASPVTPDAEPPSTEEAVVNQDATPPANAGDIAMIDEQPAPAAKRQPIKTRPPETVIEGSMGDEDDITTVV